MSEEVEVEDEARKVFISEKKGNTPDLSGQLIMESVGSFEGEVKFNTPVTAPHIIPSSSLSPTFGPASNEARGGGVSEEGEGTE